MHNGHGPTHQHKLNREDGEDWLCAETEPLEISHYTIVWDSVD